MKKLSKLLSVLMVGVFLFAMTACGGGAASTPTPAPAPAAETQTTDTQPAADTPAAPNAEEEDIAAIPKDDFGGRVFTFVCWFDNVMTSDAPEPDPNDATYSEAEVLHYEALHQFMDDYNCRVEAVVLPQEDYFANFTTSFMAGDPLGDLVMLMPENYITAIRNNMIHSVDEYVPSDADPYVSQKWSLLGIPFDGKVWYLTKRSLPIDAELMGVNLDIINALGAEDPRVLYQNGQWTWDKFMEIALLAKNTTDASGVSQYIPFSGWTQWIMESFIASNDASLVGLNGENGLTSPQTVRALEFFDRVFNVEKVGYIADGGVWDWGGNMDVYQQGRSLFFFYIDWMGAAGNADIDFEWSVVPWPKGPDNNVSGVYPTYFKGFQQAYTVPRGTKDIHQIYPMLEKTFFGYYGENSEAEDSGVRGWIESSCFNNAEDVELNVLIAGEGWKADLYESIGGIPLGDILGGITDATMTPAQAVETFSQPMQDAIDAVFK